MKLRRRCYVFFRGGKCWTFIGFSCGTFRSSLVGWLIDSFSCCTLLSCPLLILANLITVG